MAQLNLAFHDLAILNDVPDGLLLDKLLEDVEVNSSSSSEGGWEGTEVHPKEAWPEANEREEDALEQLLEACGATTESVGGNLREMMSAYEESAKSRLENWQRKRDASAEAWTRTEQQIREAWQEQWSENNCEEVRPPSTPSSPLVEHDSDDNGSEEDGEQPVSDEEPRKMPEWDTLKCRMDEIVRLAINRKESLEEQEVALAVEGPSFDPSPSPGSSRGHIDNTNTNSSIVETSTDIGE
ncbi:hypothetical protein FOL47_004597, partial [Perkinsus chesapeaki]